MALPPRRIKVAPGDVLRVPDGKGGYDAVRIADQTLGAPGPLVCQGNSWSPEPYDQSTAT